MLFTLPSVAGNTNPGCVAGGFPELSSARRARAFSLDLA